MTLNKKEKIAKKWFMIAHDYYYGIYRANGDIKFVKPNDVLAEKYFRKSAELGYEAAIHMLGSITGKGFKANRKELLPSYDLEIKKPARGNKAKRHQMHMSENNLIKDMKSWIKTM